MLVNVHACKKKRRWFGQHTVYKHFEELMLTKPRVFFKSFLATKINYFLITYLHVIRYTYWILWQKKINLINDNKKDGQSLTISNTSDYNRLSNFLMQRTGSTWLDIKLTGTVEQLNKFIAASVTRNLPLVRNLQSWPYVEVALLYSFCALKLTTSTTSLRF